MGRLVRHAHVHDRQAVIHRPGLAGPDARKERGVLGELVRLGQIHEAAHGGVAERPEPGERLVAVDGAGIAPAEECRRRRHPVAAAVRERLFHRDLWWEGAGKLNI
jgi:hypothetical protein